MASVGRVSFWQNVQSGWPHAHTAPAPHTCPRSAFACTKKHEARIIKILSRLGLVTDVRRRRGTRVNSAQPRDSRVGWLYSFFSTNTWTLCTHRYTLTNRKWCQSLSPGRQTVAKIPWQWVLVSERFLRPALTQTDTSSSVAAVHPSHSLITGLTHFIFLSLRSLSPSPSICLHLTSSLLAPVGAHKFFSISFINSEHVHGSMWWTAGLIKWWL